MAPHAPIRNAKDWGQASDLNLFAFEAHLKRSQEFGADPHSIDGDPLFVDPASGDFRVSDGSPAFKIGFENFAMDQFGVKKPSLKAIARTPIIPELLTVSKETKRRVAAGLPSWLGMSLRALQGEEFSAFGVSKEDGGVQLTPIGNQTLTRAPRVGLQKDDLVQQINGQKVMTPEELLSEVKKAGSTPIRVRLIRVQQPVEITLPSSK
jgi:hypothetical protein